MNVPARCQLYWRVMVQRVASVLAFCPLSQEFHRFGPVRSIDICDHRIGLVIRQFGYARYAGRTVLGQPPAPIRNQWCSQSGWLPQSCSCHAPPGKFERATKVSIASKPRHGMRRPTNLTTSCENAAMPGQFAKSAHASAARMPAVGIGQDCRRKRNIILTRQLPSGMRPCGKYTPRTNANKESAFSIQYGDQTERFLSVAVAQTRWSRYDMAIHYSQALITKLQSWSSRHNKPIARTPILAMAGHRVAVNPCPVPVWTT